MAQEYTDMMLDMETLGVNIPVITGSIGAVLFNRHVAYNCGPVLELPAFIVYPDMEEQQDLGASISAGTIRFWCQTQGALGALMPRDANDLYPSVTGALIDLRAFARRSGIDINKLKIWCRGTDFDFAQLRWLHHKTKTPKWFAYNAARDVRTALEMQGKPSRFMPSEAAGLHVTQGQAHHPVFDCQMQILQLTNRT